MANMGGKATNATRNGAGKSSVLRFPRFLADLRCKRRMKSRRLQGVHRLTGCRGVEVDVVDDRKWMAELQPEHDPLIERKAQRRFKGLRGWTDLPRQWSALFAVSSPGNSGRPRSFVRITFDASGVQIVLSIRSAAYSGTGVLYLSGASAAPLAVVREG